MDLIAQSQSLAIHALEEARSRGPGDSLKAIEAVKEADLVKLAACLIPADPSCRFESDGRHDMARYAASEVLGGLATEALDPALALAMLHVLRHMPASAGAEWWKNDRSLWAKLGQLTCPPQVWESVVRVWVAPADEGGGNFIAQNWELSEALEAGLPITRWVPFFKAMGIEEDPKEKIELLTTQRKSVREGMIGAWVERDLVSLQVAWNEGLVGVLDVSQAINNSLRSMRVPLPGISFACQVFPFGDLAACAKTHQGWLVKLVEIQQATPKEEEARLAHHCLARLRQRLAKHPSPQVWQRAKEDMLGATAFFETAHHPDRWSELGKALKMDTAALVAHFEAQGKMLSQRLVSRLASAQVMESVWREEEKIQPVRYGEQFKALGRALDEKENTIHPPSRRLPEVKALFEALLKHAPPNMDELIEEVCDERVSKPVAELLRSTFQAHRLEQRCAPAAPSARPRI